MKLFEIKLFEMTINNGLNQRIHDLDALVKFWLILIHQTLRITKDCQSSSDFNK